MLLTAMTGAEILQAVISILYGALTQGATALGSGINAFAQNVFLTSDGSALSVVAILACVFGGIAITVGIGRKIFSWCTKFGR